MLSSTGTRHDESGCGLAFVTPTISFALCIWTDKSGNGSWISYLLIALFFILTTGYGMYLIETHIKD